MKEGSVSDFEGGGGGHTGDGVHEGGAWKRYWAPLSIVGHVVCSFP